MVSEDRYGNQGASDWRGYEASSPCVTTTEYCPASPNSVTDHGALLNYISGHPSGTVRFKLSNGPVNQLGILYYGSTQIQAAFGCGFRCVGGTTVRSGVYTLTTNPVFLDLDLSAATLPFNIQFWYRDPANASCADTFNLSNAIHVE